MQLSCLISFEVSMKLKFVSDLRQVCGFLRVLRFPPPIKLTSHFVTEILLKVALSTIKPNQTNPQNFNLSNFFYSGGCIYDKGSWESCDPVTNKRAKKKLLKSGDTKTCTAEKLVYRSCIRANGEGTSIFR